jgi:hypothetical protein
MPSHNRDASKPKRKIAGEFTLKRATGFGGFNLLADFMDSVGFSEIACRHLEIEKAHWADYPLANMIEMLVQGYACGLQRPYQFLNRAPNDPQAPAARAALKEIQEILPKLR